MAIGLSSSETTVTDAYSLELAIFTSASFCRPAFFSMPATPCALGVLTR